MMDLLSNIVWASVVLIVFFSSKKEIFGLFATAKQLEFGPIRLIIDKVKQTEVVTDQDIKKLEAFRGEDIWVLEDIEKGTTNNSAAFKVQSYRMIKMGLIDKANGQLTLSRLGQALLDEIKKLEV